MQRSVDEFDVATSERGVFSSGVQWQIESPANPNGVGLLFSPGFSRGAQDPIRAISDAMRARLLADGFTVAGISYSTAGWTVTEGLVAQPQLARRVRSHVSRPTTVIAWGHSMGGLVSAGLAEDPDSGIDGAIAVCGSLAGPVAMLNQSLDAAFVIQQLIPEASRLTLVRVDGDAERTRHAQTVVAAAAAEPAGRARLALAAAVAQLPTWAIAGSARAEADDVEALARQQRDVIPWSVFSPRHDIESRAGGNPSWNTAVDYGRQLELSSTAWLVRELYMRADLSLAADLAALATAERIIADRESVARLHTALTPSGRIRVPVLTLWCSGDAAPVLSQAAAYETAVERSGASDLHRRLVVDRPGHTPSDEESLQAIHVLRRRLEDGGWAPRVGPEKTGAGTSFAPIEPDPFLRAEREPLASAGPEPLLSAETRESA